MLNDSIIYKAIIHELFKKRHIVIVFYLLQQICSLKVIHNSTPLPRTYSAHEQDIYGYLDQAPTLSFFHAQLK